MSLLQNEIEKLNNVTSFDIEYTWKIIDFKQQFSDEKNELESPMFSTNDHDIQFQLKFKKKFKNKNNLVLFLNCFSGETVYSNLLINAVIGILGTNGNVIKESGKLLFFVFYAKKFKYFRIVKKIS